MKHLKNVLCLVGGAGDSSVALEKALAIAEQHQARLTVMQVLEEVAPSIMPFSGGDLPEVRVALHRSALEALEAQVAPGRARVDLATKVVFGKPFIEAIREALRSGCDLLVKAAEGENGVHLFGGTDRHLLRKCPCPVLLVKRTDAQPYRRIVAAVDFDPDDVGASEAAINREILELAASMAIAGFAELHVVHVWEALAETVLRVWGDQATDASISTYVERERLRHEDGLNRLAADLSAWVGSEARAYVAPQLHLVRGAAQEQVPALARELNTELIVMGTLGRTGVPGLLIGNTAETILERIPCSVLAVKPQGFVSPVALEG